MGKRIVVKIGSNVISGKQGKIDRRLLRALIGELAARKKRGYEIMIITSGAVSSGREVLKFSDKDKVLERQVFASLGQARLVEFYSSLFQKQGIKVAQLLLTREDFLEQRHFTNFQQAAKKLLSLGVIPIINENDAIAVADKAFLNNDQLAALSAVAVSADRLIILSNIDGLYTADPTKDKSAELIGEVTDAGKDLEKYCFKKKSTFGLGGMLEKVRAAGLAANNGIKVVIVNGLAKNPIANALEGKVRGTVFVPKAKKIRDRQKWLLVGASSRGKIMIDRGAAEALRHGKSLLAVGIEEVYGDFGKRDIVEVVDGQGETIATGISAYDCRELAQAIAYKKSGKNSLIKKKFSREVIHVDNLTVI